MGGQYMTLRLQPAHLAQRQTVPVTTFLLSLFLRGGSDYNHAWISEGMVVTNPLAALYQEEEQVLASASILAAPLTSSGLRTSHFPSSQPVSSSAKWESVWGNKLTIISPQQRIRT